jgi:hypothetical protein
VHKAFPEILEIADGLGARLRAICSNKPENPLIFLKNRDSQEAPMAVPSAKEELQ